MAADEGGRIHAFDTNESGQEQINYRTLTDNKNIVDCWLSIEINLALLLPNSTDKVYDWQHGPFGKF